jgi:hypothetical protein
MTILIGFLLLILGFLIARCYYLQEQKISELRTLKGFIGLYCCFLKHRFDDLEQKMADEDESDYQKLEYFITQVEIAKTHDDLLNFWESGFRIGLEKALNEKLIDWYIV